MAVDLSEEIKTLDATLAGIETVLDIEGLRRRAQDLEQEAADPDLWSDQVRAQSVTRRLSSVKGDIARVEGLRRRLDDLIAALDLGDDDLLAEAAEGLPALARDISALEVRTLLSGEYDERDAIIQLSAGAGGVDAADWTAMLLRMYLRWAERHGYSTEVFDTSEAEEAGLKSATFQVKCPYAYGTLRSEHGVHRLVRISPFDNQNRRQTSFAGVEVTPAVEVSDHVDIDEKELRIDIFRSSGPGGQGVNTTDSAVRITHLPSNIVVTCQNERSQLQNKAAAMMVLQAKLLERRRAQEAAEKQRLTGGPQDVSFGSQIRNYVLHPYQMVKDLRTEVETSNTGAVLDGDIDDFIDGEIRWRRAAEKDA
ncbi:peptide chain release factor 2 [Parafrankia colletiae]|uniref:Peptide chain release factor 2 n=1 Tax=Parafrankia colletiae TaxID=573497 RepID=A0A1S1QCR0_9ACTN|nr:peptide chain release factor 2 [Parafrankia colletiae]MCK9902597.1 peptide chain release factor 2 [Frankia sp. Cpl3]OHV31427.1 peptide chain release factor 2 [Parafrankia colletiae]